MNDKRFKLISYVITATIIVTIVIQGYWNYQHYLVNKQHLKNDVQLALDNGIEAYYADLARNTLFAHSDSIDRDLAIGWRAETDSLRWTQLKESANQNSRIHGFKITMTDSVIRGDSVEQKQVIRVGSHQTIRRLRGADLTENLNDLATRIVISLEADSLDMEALSAFVSAELDRMELEIDYNLILNQTPSDTPQGDKPKLVALANTSYLAPGNNVSIQYSNITLEILKRGGIGLLISLLITSVIIGVQVFLFRVIKSQKELSEIKNDLISNITHEFKTPIATSVTALDGIKHFNPKEDPDKTKRYIQVAHDQLTKLNEMVEKLLETATMDRDQLVLAREEVDLSESVKNMINKYQLVSENKEIKTKIQPEVRGFVDPFHFENALSNLIDNAIKYGGPQIDVGLKRDNGHLELTVTDNGGNIPVSVQDKVFEKFYRIPTGDQHDIKGYGIGLYHAKKVIEKHGGKLTLRSTGSLTEFKIVV